MNRSISYLISSLVSVPVRNNRTFSSLFVSKQLNIWGLHYGEYTRDTSWRNVAGLMEEPGLGSGSD